MPKTKKETKEVKKEKVEKKDEKKAEGLGIYKVLREFALDGVVTMPNQAIQLTDSQARENAAFVRKINP